MSKILSEILSLHGEAIVSTCQIISMGIGPIVFIACVWALATIEIKENK